jgi:hypothetical protein
MDYTDGTRIAKWQWDLIHDPGVIVRVFERDEDAMKIEREKDFSVFYGDYECNQRDTLYMLNGFNKIINLQTKKRDKEQWQSLKVDWNIKDKEYKNIDSITLQMQDFELTDFNINIKHKNYISTLYIQFLDVNIKQEIILVLQELLDIEKIFYNIVDSIDAEIVKSKFDAFLIKGKDNTYTSKGMHKLIDASNNMETENRLFGLIHQLYEIDLVIAKYDGKFDEIINNINKIMTKDEAKNIYIDTIFQDYIISKIEEIQHVSTTETEQWYKSFIKTTVIKTISSDE